MCQFQKPLQTREAAHIHGCRAGVENGGGSEVWCGVEVGLVAVGYCSRVGVVRDAGNDLGRFEGNYSWRTFASWEVVICPRMELSLSGFRMV